MSAQRVSKSPIDPNSNVNAKASGGQGVAVHFFCDKFVAAKVLQKKLEVHKTICNVHEHSDLDQISSISDEGNGIILIHVSQLLEIKKLRNLVIDLKDRLTGGSLSIVVISRIQALQVKTYLNGYPSIFVFQAASALADIEKKVFELLRKYSGEQIDMSTLFNNEQPGKPQRVLRYAAGSEGETFVMKGSAQKKTLIIQEGNGQGEAFSATQSQASFGANDLKYQPGAPTQSEENSKLNEPSVPNVGTSAKVFSGPAPIIMNDRRAKPQVEPPAAKKQLGEIFNSVNSPEQRQKFLRDCVESKALITMTSPRSEAKISGQFFNLDSNGTKLLCTIRGRTKDQEAFRSSLSPGQPIILSAALRQSRLFMATPEVVWYNQNPQVIELKVPDKIFYVQRRRTFRYVFFPSVSDYATFNRTKAGAGELALPIYDMSEGGVGFLANADEVELLRKCQNLYSMRFQVEDLQIQCPVIAQRHITPLPIGSSTTLFRVGYQYSDLKAEIRGKIGKFIEAVCQQYFNTYLAADKQKA